MFACLPYDIINQTLPSVLVQLEYIGERYIRVNIAEDVKCVIQTLVFYV